MKDKDINKYHTYKDTQNFVILAVDIQDDAGVDAVRNFLGELGLTFPVLLDGDGSAAAAYNVLGLPTSFFIDRLGVIRASRVGISSPTYMEEQLQKIFNDE